MSHISTKDAAVVLTLLTIPLPALYSFNQFLATHTLDALHYILFQLLFLALAPLYQLGFLSDSKKRLPKDRQLVRMNGSVGQSDQSTKASTKIDTNTLVENIGQHMDASKKIGVSSSVPDAKVDTVAPAASISKHPYDQECEDMTARFSSLIDEDADAPGSPWTIMVNQLQPSFLKIYKHKEADFCYKIIATADNTPETAFDLLSNVTKRPEWDDLCDSTRIIEELDQTTKIQYVKMKPIWPTSARDTVLLSYVKQLEDGRYLNVTKSVVHNQCPELTDKGIVRMEAGLAGQVVGPEPGFPNKCRVVQIVDGDPKGWIPKSVIKFVATTALPKSFRQLNQKLSLLPPQTISQVISTPTLSGSAPHLESISKDIAPPHKEPTPINTTSSSESNNLNEILARFNRLEQQLVVLTSSVRFGILDASRPLQTLRRILDFFSPFMVTGIFFYLVKRWAAKKFLNKTSR